MSTKIKFIPCSETSQIFSFSRTNRKSSYRDQNMEMVKREEAKKARRRKKKKL
jgi:hypothetical protein